MKDFENQPERNASSQPLVVAPASIVEIDAGNLLDAGKDPFSDILQMLNTLPKTKCLRVVNSFEPVALISLVTKRGYRTWVDKKGHNIYYTYICIAEFNGFLNKDN
ncbi:MAG: hypothetical protein RIS47_1717 [Bacteroidota bacterium]|jgi:hypothetical protein